jgi:hypothetical protein
MAAKRALEHSEVETGGSPQTKRARVRSPSLPLAAPVNDVHPQAIGYVSAARKPPFANLGEGIGEHFAATSLGFELATDLLVASLHAIDAETLTSVIGVSRTLRFPTMEHHIDFLW